MSRDPLVSNSSAAVMVAALSAAGQTISTAESLTAGLVAATIAGVPGASSVLIGGTVVYATRLKASLGGVEETVLAVDGAVSAKTAEQLAAHVREQTGSDWGVSLTGVAGPEPQEGHPPGTVFLGFANHDQVYSKKLALVGDRWDIRTRAVEECLSEVLSKVLIDSGNQLGPR